MLLMALALAAAHPQNSVVKIDGKGYRVRTNGLTVKVSQKAFFTKLTVEARDRMRRAVKTATGCNLVDEYWDVTSLEGKLSC